MRIRYVLVILVGLNGCAAPINERVARNYERVGAAAQARGDWDAARRAYARSATNADLARSSPQERAVYHYEYGRSLGVTCFFNEAERELNLAYDLDRQAGQPLYFSLVELARLTLDQHKFPQSVLYFERALTELDRANAGRDAPMGYADVLDEYALALSGAGRTQDSTTMRKRALEIRDANPGGHSITDRTPYGRHCMSDRGHR
jgi:tetratricopeptide (TPR) repeat protein